jgi:VWFA-related protein
MKLFYACALLLSLANAQEPIDTHATIRTETRVVLVDSVVTDKNGAYVHGLAQKDFKVWEDNKEQTITSFSFLADPSNAPKRYLVLFFDNSTVSPASQIYARQAATKFIDSNAGPDRQIAIVEFNGTLRIAQNFTGDADRLKQVVSGVKLSTVPANGAGLPAAVANFSTRTVLGALRDMAKCLSTVPGRKTLVFLSSGFPINPDTLTEVTATFDACNRANVAIYPIDVRALVAPGRAGMPGYGAAGLAALQVALLTGPLAFQRNMPANGGSTDDPFGGTVGGPAGTMNPRGGAGRPNMNNDPFGGNSNSSLSQRRSAQLKQILPPLNNSVTGPQQVLYALANGTGGFVIVNTSDMLGGLDKIGKEQNEYYLLGYTPSKEPEPGTCHTLKVKVDRGDAMVRSRTGYCDAKTVDLLSGTPAERDLETRARANATPTVAASMQAPFFYIAPDTARVDVALDIPSGLWRFAKEKGKFQSTMNIVGIAYLTDGSVGVGARFSDAVKMTFDDKKQADDFSARPFHYEKQFEMASGQYNLKVVFGSSADSFGKVELPLVVDPWEPSQFALSGLAFSNDLQPAGNTNSTGDTGLEERVPLIFGGSELKPSGTSRFRKTDQGFLYAELYQPALIASPDIPAMGVSVQFLDAKTGQVIKDVGISRVPTPSTTGNPVVPLGLRLPIGELPMGAYQLKVTGLDEAGHQTTRTANLEIIP